MEELESICLCVMPAARSGVPPPWKKELQIPPTMSSSHSVQPKNSSIPRSPIVFPQPLWGGQLYLESPNNDDYNRAFFYYWILMEQLVLGCVSKWNMWCWNYDRFLFKAFLRDKDEKDPPLQAVIWWFAGRWQQQRLNYYISWCCLELLHTEV